MSDSLWYANGVAVRYVLLQVFTRMASDRIGDGRGGFVTEGSHLTLEKADIGLR